MGQKRLTGDFAPVTVISENRKDDRKRNMLIVALVALFPQLWDFIVEWIRMNL